MIFIFTFFSLGLGCDKEDEQVQQELSDQDSMILYDEFWLKEDYEKAVANDTQDRKYIVFESSNISGFDGCKAFDVRPIGITVDSFIWKDKTTVSRGTPLENCDLASFGNPIEPDSSWIGYEIVDMTLTISRKDASPLIFVRDGDCTMQDPCGD